MAKLIYVARSHIHGKGVFAGVDLLPGLSMPVPTVLTKQDHHFNLDMEDGTMRRPYSPFCFLNHSPLNNAELNCYENEQFYLEIVKVIPAGREITINYGPEWTAEFFGEWHEIRDHK